MEPVFYVYQPSTGYTQHEHASQMLAENEAERLASLSPGTTYMVLVAISKCIKKNVDWERVDPDCIPF